MSAAEPEEQMVAHPQTGPTTPLVFGAEQELLGMITLPPGELIAGLGAVLCPPLGRDNVFSHRPLRTLAHHLAAEGLPVLRFDWPGCGDSAELPLAFPGVELWFEAIDQAIAALIDATGVQQVTLVGLGIGASFALCVAQEHPAVSDVIALGPYARGRSYLRALHAAERLLRQLDFTTPGLVPPPPPPDGSIESGGFALSEAEVAALAPLDLGAAPPPVRVPARALLAAAHADRASVAIAERLRAAGTEVTTQLLPDLPYVFDPERVFLPRSCTHAILEWLRARPLPACSLPRPSLPTRTTLLLADGSVREQAEMISTARGNLFALRCEPGGNVAPTDWVVFLNTGSIRRIGSHRLFTVWARRWAQQGVASLRLDIRGVGDGDCDLFGDEQLNDDPSLAYRPDRLGDIAAALDWLAESHGAERFAMIGLCSGATLALQTALADRRVVAAGIANPPGLFWDDELMQLTLWHYARNRLSQPLAPSQGGALAPRARALARGARHQLQRPGFAVELLRGRKLHHSGWHRREIRAGLARLQREGTELLAVYADGDVGVRYLAQTLGSGYRRELEALGMRVELIEGADHTFRQVWSHAVLRERLEQLLARAGFLETPSSNALPEAASYTA